MNQFLHSLLKTVQSSKAVDGLVLLWIESMELIVYPGGPHGITDTHKDRLNADLLDFIKA